MPILEFGLGSSVGAAAVQVCPSSCDVHEYTCPAPVRNNISKDGEGWVASCKLATVFSINHVVGLRTLPRGVHVSPRSEQQGHPLNIHGILAETPEEGVVYAAWASAAMDDSVDTLTNCPWAPSKMEVSMHLW
eukprot:CAMPEP_0114234790 /NCGR_PEP_ID=MMETSP0058-20121206/5896_1 /TAXON_ID=36894 /ORGANISM="Pyramimonas parkeae, CCMP726" /LENGTH=132 /DNA_ID=CAMNT_0001346491 /DNA_START=400 /DNA_END=796 /DNA_ORIENTATION=-